MDTKQSRFYEHTLRLRPALGDWTQLRRPADQQEKGGRIGAVSAGFDALSRRQLDAVHHLHYVFSDALVGSLVSDLGVKVELHSITVRQLPYDKIAESETRPMVQTDISDTRSTFSILWDWELARTVVQRLLGNRGPLEDQSTFTRMELGVVETALTDILTAFRTYFAPSQWEGEFTLRSRAGEFLPLPTMNGNDGVVMIQFVLSLGNSRPVSLKWIYASRVAARLISAFIRPEVTHQIALSPGTKDRTRYTLAAQLGTATLTMKDIAELRAGDIVLLDQRVHEPIHITLDHKSVLKGRPGISGRKLAVQLIHPQAASVTAPQTIVVAPPSEPPEPDLAPAPAAWAPPLPAEHSSPVPMEADLVEEGAWQTMASEPEAPLPALTADTSVASAPDDFSDLSDMDHLDEEFSWDDLEDK